MERRLESEIQMEDSKAVTLSLAQDEAAERAPTPPLPRMVTLTAPVEAAFVAIAADITGLLYVVLCERDEKKEPPETTVKDSPRGEVEQEEPDAPAGILPRREVDDRQRVAWAPVRPHLPSVAVRGAQEATFPASTVTEEDPDVAELP